MPPQQEHALLHLRQKGTPKRPRQGRPDQTGLPIAPRGSAACLSPGSVHQVRGPVGIQRRRASLPEQ